MKSISKITRFSLLTKALLVLSAVLICSHPVTSQVTLTGIGATYSQSFDTLPASGSVTWTNNSTIPGWYHARTGTGTTITANDGSNNGGNFYSYGTGTNTDRAIGSLGSGNAAVGNLFWGVRLLNNTGTTITSLNVSFVGEQWRNSAAAAQTISFSYLIGSPTVTGSLAEFQSAGVAVPSLDFTSPITGGTAGALNGNLAANRVALNFTITGLNIPVGTEIMLRWADPDHTGADHGLSIDDFSATPFGTVSAASVTIGGRVLGATNRPINRAVVYLTDQSGETKTAMTNAFGYYRFQDVNVGQVYTLNVFSKRYLFEPQVLTVNEEMDNLNFLAQP